jgi:hypothetical protein
MASLSWDICMAGETLGSKRNFGQELRAATDNKAERSQILREMICVSGGIDEDSARRVLDAFQDAELAIVTEEGWEKGVKAEESLQSLRA